MKTRYNNKTPKYNIGPKDPETNNIITEHLTSPNATGLVGCRHDLTRMPLRDRSPDLSLFNKARVSTKYSANPTLPLRKGITIYMHMDKSRMRLRFICIKLSFYTCKVSFYNYYCKRPLFSHMIVFLKMGVRSQF